MFDHFLILCIEGLTIGSGENFTYLLCFVYVFNFHLPDKNKGHVNSAQIFKNVPLSRSSRPEVL